MEGPYKLINNKWEKSPLERIQQSIDEASMIIRETVQNLSFTDCKMNKANKLKEIENIQKTINNLEEEKRLRKITEDKLWLKREKLLQQISETRYQKNRNKDSVPQIKKMVDRVIKIDNKLGPYRYNGREFYLN